MKFDVDRFVKLSALIGAVVTFAWGVFQYADGREREATTRRIEATKPFLDRQLALYTEATLVTAAIATSTDKAESEKAKERFWRLYYGELVLVEDRFVEAAMVAFGRELNASARPEELKQLSLQLARQCRESLSISWGVAAWRDPHKVAREEKLNLLMGP